MKHIILAGWIISGLLVGCATNHTTRPTVAHTVITEAEVNAAQQAWCDSLLNIAQTYAKGGDYQSVATAMLNNQYNYNDGNVLFKPTMTFDEQTFRLDREAATAYFIGGNPKFPDDKGFALKPWVHCRYTNAGVIIDGDYAFTMGNVIITDNKNKETKVDKFFAFKRGTDGKLRIVVHKSAVPFNPND